MNILEKISTELKLDLNYLKNIANRSAYYYKKYEIPKRNGGSRIIYQPAPELKTLQYWTVYNIFKKLPVSKYACAYKKGDSIKKHAERHKNSKFIFHTDIHSFFNSINTFKLYNILVYHKDIFENMGLNLNESIANIEKICFYNGHLTIGAVSSPIISNIVMYQFDCEVFEYCNTKDMIYTRYADDIYISSNAYIENEITDYITQKLVKYGFSVNRKKTGFYSPKQRHIVTGLTLTDTSTVSVGTDMRNKIKKMIYKKLTKNEGNPLEILGYLAYLKDIEPATYNSFITKYSNYCSGDIIEELKK